MVEETEVSAPSDPVAGVAPVEASTPTPAEISPSADQVMPAEKPPTQTFSTEGTDFTSVAVKQKAAQDRLARLPQHPPFQMFIEQVEPNEQRINSVQYAMERGIAAMGRMGEDAFIASYVDWWTDKGYWKDEDPFGGAAAASGPA